MSKFIENLSELSDESISSVVTDPTEHTNETWEECFRVLKPGGYLLAFSDTIKYHRLAVAVEDAGFEIRDSLHWSFGKDGKDGVQHRVIAMARKPLVGTVIETVLAHGTGAINIDASRVGSEERTYNLTMTSGNFETTGGGKNRVSGSATVSGRFPTNTVFTHSPGCSLVGTKTETMTGGYGNGGIGMSEVGQDGGAGKGAEWQQKETSSLVFECAPVCPVRTLDEQSGFSKSGKPRDDRGKGGIWSEGDGVPCGPQHGDQGGASRFFKQTEWTTLDTDKPLELITYLLRMVTPPGGTVLDPYLGDGDTAVAAELCGYEWVGVTETPNTVMSRIANTIH